MQLGTWLELATFAATVLTCALYGLAASGHFPAEHRARTLRNAPGGIVLWGTLVMTVLVAVLTARFAWARLPWHGAVIAGGAMLLVAPLVLQRFSDRFVDGWAALLMFSGLAALFVTVTCVL